MARTLKQAGYATGMAGKWRQMSDTPGDWGFDEWLTDPTAGGWYWKNSYTKNNELVETPEEIYGPDVCMEFARDFLRRHRDEPFYFYFPTHLIHGPILRTPDSKAESKADLYVDNVARQCKPGVDWKRSRRSALIGEDWRTAGAGMPWRGPDASSTLR